MTRIIMVRHGRSLANESHHFACRTDTPLSPLGVQQAKAVAAYLAAREKIDAVYASPLSRVVDTVIPTAKAFGLPVTTDEGLIEIDGGLWENLPYEELRARFAASYAVWCDDVPNAHPEEGESVRDLYTRVISTVKRLAEENRGKTILIGSHWTPTSAVLAEATAGSPDAMSHGNWVVNASIHIFTYEDGKLTAVKTPITKHLLPDLM